MLKLSQRGWMMNRATMAAVWALFPMVSAQAFDFPDISPEEAKTSVLQSGETGGIDWTNGFIYAKGEGVPMAGLQHKGQARLTAQRAAKIDAERNLLEMVKGVQIDSNSTVDNFMLTSDVIKTSVSGVLKGFQIVPNPATGEEYAYLSDGTVRVTIRIPLNGFGGLSEVLLPSPEQGSGNKGGGKDKVKKKETTGDGVRTGLVVDAKGLKIKPALRPRLLDEDGEEVYGTGSVDRDYAIRVGVAGYLKDVEKAEEHERVADNALVIKGLRPEGPARTDVVLSQEDADQIRKMARKMSFLDQCRVIYVID